MQARQAAVIRQSGPAAGYTVLCSEFGWARHSGCNVLSITR